MKKRVTKYLRNISIKKRINLIDRLLLKSLFLYKKLRNNLAKKDNKNLSKLYLWTRNIERGLIGTKYSFVTIDDLVIWTTEWLKTFPNSYDLIIGIPRSGLLIANLVALKLGKPLTTPELFIEKRYWKSKLINKAGDYKNILLIDDSITSGKSMEKNFKILNSCYKNLNIIKAALITTEQSKKLVDLYFKIIPHPRIFEWNLLHSKKGKLATDLDGVICENCPPGVDSNEELYVDWIGNAKPYLVPSFEIDVILSNRLERYRSDTEEWLNKYNVRYKELILWDIQSKEQRNNNHAQRKIEVLLKIKPDIFWESSLYEAKQIWKYTKIPTLCIDEMILFGP